MIGWLDCSCSQYLAELLAEHQKLGPFMQVLPICSKLLSQGEIFSSFFFDLPSSSFLAVRRDFLFGFERGVSFAIDEFGKNLHGSDA